MRRHGLCDSLCSVDASQQVDNKCGQNDRRCAIEWSDNTSKSEGNLNFLVLLLLKGAVEASSQNMGSCLFSVKLKTVTLRACLSVLRVLFTADSYERNWTKF